MNWVRGKEKASHHGHPAPSAKAPAQERVERGDKGVEEEVHHVETGGPHAVQEAVPAEGEDGEGTVRLVRLCL